MEIEVQALPGASNVTCAMINGRIDSYTTERVEEELNSLIRIGSFKLICDLTDVGFVSSSGFKAFKRIITLAREQGGDVKFCGLSSEVAKLFNSVGFSKEVAVFATPEQALVDFENPGANSESEAGSGLSIDDSSLQETKIFSKDSSLQETVVFSKNQPPKTEAQPERAGNFPEFDPITFRLYPESSHFQEVSQLLGKIGGLVGVSSTEMVKLNVAFTEFCRCMVEELEPSETFAVQIDSSAPGVRVHIDIPRKDYNIYQNLKPKTTSKSLSEEECREWFFNYVDEVDQSASDLGTEYVLSLTE